MTGTDMIDVMPLPSGSYIVKVVADQDHQEYLKLVKQ